VTDVHVITVLAVVVEHPVAVYMTGVELLYVAVTAVPTGPKFVPPIVTVAPPAVFNAAGTAVTAGTAYDVVPTDAALTRMLAVVTTHTWPAPTPAAAWHVSDVGVVEPKTVQEYMLGEAGGPYVTVDVLANPDPAIVIEPPPAVASAVPPDTDVMAGDA
jgi:hypothetical protein